MKKSGKLLGLLLVGVLCASLAGCSEGALYQSGSTATAIGLGHGNCVTEVTVSLDKYGQVQKVRFDDIFPASNVYNNVALCPDAPKTTVEGKEFFTYLHIGSRYFQVNESGIYKEIGATNGTPDLMTYYKTAEGTQWYYDSFMNKALYICVEADDGTQVGDVKLKDKCAFNTSNGSMRKRYSRYWSTLGSGNISQSSGLGFNGNMEMLEEYLLTYGFDALQNPDTAITLPKKDGNDSPYNVIGGVTTGATLSADTGVYLKIAKAAYDKAVAAQK